MTYLAVLAFVVGLGLPIAVLAAATAQGRATSTALEGIARQPEAAAKIQLAMIIGLALIESLVIYSLLIFLLLQNRLPSVSEVMEMIKIAAEAAKTAKEASGM